MSDNHRSTHEDWSLDQPASAVRTQDRAHVTVNVQVGVLVLDGLSLAPMQAVRLRTALQDKLGILLSAESLAPRLRLGGVAPSLPGPALSISEWRDPADLGRRIAQALHEGLWR
jgi:hypothetical protein